MSQELVAQHYVKNEYTVIHVKFKESYKPANVVSGFGGRFGISAIDKLSAKYKAVSIHRIFPESGIYEEAHKAYGLHLWYEIRFMKGLKLEHAIKDFRKIQNFEYVDECKPYTSVWSELGEQPILESGSNDPLFGNQWHFNNTGQGGGNPGADIKLLDAWKKETGSPNVIVAVIDGGIQLTHPDLTGALWVNSGEIPGNRIDDDGNGYVDDVNGYNFADNNGFIAGNFHGTHVAGTIGAVTNNGIGVSGIAGGSGSNDGVKLMSCVGFGNIATGGFEAAMVYAADNGAVISQNSWGGGSNAIEAAINYFVNRAGFDNTAARFHQNIQIGPMAGGLVIFAAGNSNSSDPNVGYPASYPKVIAVASTDRNDQKSSFSNYGTWVDISAPGSAVLSTSINNGFEYLSGTSMACPHVSGVAALVISNLQGPGLSPTDVWNRLRLGARSINVQNPGFQGLLGAGRLDASLALRDPDDIPPAPITDLRVERVTATSVVLKWTATGESDYDGQAMAYDLRFSTEPLTPSNFNTGTKVSGLPDPPISGEEVTFEVRDLLPATNYFFAIKSEDIFYFVSEISNVIEVITLNPPIPQLITAELSVGLYTGAVQDAEILVKNIGEDNLLVRLAVPDLQPADVGLPTGAKGRLFAINAFANRIDEINCRSGNLIRSIPLPAPSASSNEGLAFDGEYLYYGRANMIYKIQVNSGEVVRTFSIQSTYGITGLGWSGRYLYASVFQNSWSYVFEIDSDDGTIIRTLSTNFFQGLSFGGKRGTIFSVNGNYLSELNIETGAVVRQFTNGNYAKALGYSVTENLLYISKSNFIEALNPNTAEKVYSIPYPTTTALASDEYLPGWILASEQTVAIASGDTQGLPFKFVATGLSDGQWQGTLRVLPLNTQHPPFAVPIAMQVTSAPDIEIISALDYGLQYKDISADTIILLENRGFSDLEILSIQSSDGRVSVSAGSGVLAAGQMLPVTITLTPDNTGLFEAQIRITSNDPDEGELVIPVQALVWLAPVLTVSPGQLTTTMQVGEQKTLSFTVSNTGESDLNYSIRFSGADSPWTTAMSMTADTLSWPAHQTMMLEEEGFIIKANSPEPVTGLVHPTQSDYIYAKSLGGNTFYRYNLITDTWEIIGLTPANVSGQAAFLHGKLYFAGDRLHVYELQSGNWNSIAFPVEITTTSLATDGQYIYVPLAHDFYRFDPIATTWQQLADVPTGLWGHVAGLSHFSGTIFAHMLSTFEGDGNTPLFKYFISSNTWMQTKSIPGKVYDGNAVDPADKTFIVSGKAPANSSVTQISVLDIVHGEWTALLSPINFASQPIYVSKVGFSGFYFVEQHGTSVIYYETPQAPEWMTIETTRGVLSPGQSQIINIHLNASVLIDGTYTGKFIVRGNHPILYSEVPLTVTVVGAPDISVTTVNSFPDEIWLGREFGLPVRIRNTGTAFLNVANIDPGHADVSVSQSTLFVPPGEERSLTVYILPSQEGIWHNEVAFFSNDPDEEMVTWSFTTNVVAPPVPELSPGLLTAELMSGDTILQYLTLTNSGGGLMDYSIDSDNPWLSGHSVGYLPAGQTAVVPVTIDASGLSTDTYNGKFLLWHQGYVWAEVSVELTVTSAPDIFTDPYVLDFGERLVDYAHAEQISIQNKGVIPLHITSIQSTNTSSISISETGPIELMPMESMELLVTFQPDQAGAYSGNLVFQSDDPNESTYTLQVTGIGIHPPVAVTDVTEVQVDLFPDEILSETVLLQNTGESELSWKIYSNQELPVSGTHFTVLNPSPAKLTSLVIDPETNIMYGQYPYYNRVYRYEPSSNFWVESFGTHGRAGLYNSGGAVILNKRMYCTYSEDPLNIYVFHMILRNWTLIPNQLGAGTGTITTDGTMLYLAGGGNFMRYDPATKEWKNLPLPARVNLDGMGGLQYHDGFIYAHGKTGNGFARFNVQSETWEDLPSLPGTAVLGSTIDPVRKRYYAYGREHISYLYEYDITYNVWNTYLFDGFEVNNGGMVFNDTPEYEGVYFIEGINGTGFARFEPGDQPNWLRPFPLVGNVQASESTIVGVNLSSYGMTTGQYLGLLDVVSNDPVNDTVSVAVRMNVLDPVPSIAVPGEIKDTVDRVLPRTFGLRIKNNGREALNWSIPDVLPPNLSMSKSSGVLFRKGEEVIDITFNPAFFSSSFLDYTLVINSNDATKPQVPVRLLFTLPNKQPEVISSPGDQLLTVESLQISLLDVFNDPDNDPLTFRVTSSLPQVAAATITGLTLTINPRLSGTSAITVTATDTYNASADIHFNAVVDRVTGVEPVDHQKSLDIFPNPFSEKFIIRYTTQNPKTASVVVFDISGRAVYRVDEFAESLGVNTIEVNGGELLPGLYTCFLLQNGKSPLKARLVKK